MKNLKKYKNKILIAIIVFFALFICYIIGQKIVLPSRMVKEGFTDTDGNVVEYSILEHFNQFSFVGVEPMNDVPGEQTMCLLTLDQNSNVEEEWYGNYIFMTPNVSMTTQMKIKSQYNTLSFEYAMHPWIEAGVSDGAEIVVEIVVDGDEQPVIHEAFQVESSEVMKRAEVDLSSLRGKKVTIGISCTGGDNNNENGDWVLLRYPVID